MKTIEQDPSAILDYGVDWSDWLNDADEIDTSSWSVDPSGELVVETGSESTSTTETECNLKIDDSVSEDDVIGNEYIVTNGIVTTDGLEDERSFRVRIVNK